MESKKTELIDTESELVVARGRVGGWVKGVKLPVIRSISSRDLIYSMVTTVNHTVLYTRKMLRE